MFDRGAKILHASGPKNPKHKTNSIVTNSINTLKMVHIKKKLKINKNKVYRPYFLKFTSLLEFISPHVKNMKYHIYSDLIINLYLSCSSIRNNFSIQIVSISNNRASDKPHWLRYCHCAKLIQIVEGWYVTSNFHGFWLRLQQQRTNHINVLCLVHTSASINSK